MLRKIGDFSLDATTFGILFIVLRIRRLSISGVGFSLGGDSLLVPAIESQDDEADNRASPSPFVTPFLKVSQPTVGPFDMVVGPHPFGGRAVEEGHHLVELVAAEHRHCLGPVGNVPVPRVFDPSGSTASRLVGTLLGIEQAVNREDELPQGAEGRQGLEHLAEPASLTAVEVFGSGCDQMAMLPDEVSLLLLGFTPAGLGALLSLGGSAPSARTSAFLGELASESSQGIEDRGVDVFEDVEDAELMAGMGPEFGEEFGVEGGAVGDDDLG